MKQVKFFVKFQAMEKRPVSSNYVTRRKINSCNTNKFDKHFLCEPLSYTQIIPAILIVLQYKLELFALENNCRIVFGIIQHLC